MDGDLRLRHRRARAQALTTHRKTATDLTAGALADVAAPAHAAEPRYIGGTPVGAPSNAPFTVLVIAASGSGVSLCTGSVIDQTHVLTAAHCTVNDQGQRYPAGSFTIGIGFASLDAEDALFGPVGSVRVHPEYDPATGRADVAVLAVPPIAPGSTIAPIPLTPVGTPVAAGSVVRGYGWGDTGSPATDSLEQMLDLTVGSPTDCWSGVPGVGCARSDVGSACPGDSGGPIVRDGVQVGVLTMGVGLNCAAGTLNGFIDLSAPGIGLFVRGNDSPPPMPFTTTPASLTPPPLGGGAAM
ncbi:MAG TPA: trypsin-like serine protease, partial [Solirubrobacter sp.]|nr:trypsin-like serine protease [Solirubrobacter sp.]